MAVADRTELIAAIDAWHASWIEPGLLPCALTLIAHRGVPVAVRSAGAADVATRVPCERDTIFRIFSMTKPITAAVAMTFVDEGALSLDAPVAEFIPSFANLMVNRSPDPMGIDATPAAHVMTVRQLLTHTAGLTYGGDPDAVSQMYVDRGVHFGVFEGSLQRAVDRLAGIPLRFEPGEKWHYSVSLDVLGRVLEVVAGQRLDAVFAERILGPVGMPDTTFEVPVEKLPRLAALYEVRGDSFVEYPVGRGMPGEGPVETLSGGAGLMSTIDDYWRFAEMIRADGMAQGTRVLSESAVRLMRTNALPGDIASCGEPTFSETPTAGVGFGLGGSVVINPEVTAWRTSQGEYAWGGYASTAFVVDPVRDVVAIFMTQLIPSNAYPRLRGGLRDLVADFFTG